MPEREKPTPPELAPKFVISRELQENPEKLKKMSGSFNEIQEKVAQGKFNLRDYGKAIDRFEDFGMLTELVRVKGLSFNEARDKLEGKEFLALGKTYWGYTGPEQEGVLKPYEKYIFDGMRGYIRKSAIETSKEQFKARKETEREMSSYFREIQDLAVAGKLDKKDFGQAIERAKDFKIIREVSTEKLEELTAAKREVMEFNKNFYVYSGPRPEKQKRPPLEFSIYQAIKGGGTIPEEKEGYLYTQMKFGERRKAIEEEKKKVKVREEEKHEVWVERYTESIDYNQSSQSFRHILENPKEEELYADLTQALLPEKLQEKYGKYSDSLGQIEEKIKTGQKLSPDLLRIRKEAQTTVSDIKEAQNNFLKDPKYKRDREDKEFIVLSELILKGRTPSEIRDRLKEKNIRLEVSPSYLEKPKALIKGSQDVLGEILDREITRKEKDRQFISALQEKRKQYQAFLEPEKAEVKVEEIKIGKTVKEKYSSGEQDLKGIEKKIETYPKEGSKKKLRHLKGQKSELEERLEKLREELVYQPLKSLTEIYKRNPKQAQERAEQMVAEMIKFARPKMIIDPEDYKILKEEEGISKEAINSFRPSITQIGSKERKDLVKKGRKLVEISNLSFEDIELVPPFKGDIKLKKGIRSEDLVTVG